jgi:hypothetical protein
VGKQCRNNNNKKKKQKKTGKRKWISFVPFSGNIDSKRKSNFLVVDSKTSQVDIEDAFRRFTDPDARPAVGVLLLAQSVAQEIRYLLGSIEMSFFYFFIFFLFS